MTTQTNADYIRRRFSIIAVENFVQSISKTLDINNLCKGTETLKFAVKAQTKHPIEPTTVLIKISVLHTIFNID